MPLLAVSLGAAAPGNLGAAHLFIAALAAGVLTTGIAVVTQRHISVAATVVTLSAIGGLVAAARMWRPIPAQWLGMLTLVGLLFLLTLAPTSHCGQRGSGRPTSGPSPGATCSSAAPDCRPTRCRR